MKRMEKVLAVSVALTLAVFSGCSSDDDDNNDNPTVNEFEVLADHLDGELVDLTSGWIQSAEYVHTNMDELFIVDIRAADAYNSGHIAGAVNVTDIATLEQALADNGATMDEIAIVCYTGQTAAFAAMGLRMLGYDAFSMSFGMSGWHTDFDNWTGNTSNNFAGDFVDTAAPALGEFTFPTLSTGLDNAQGILEARVAAVFAEGFGDNAISAAGVFSALTDYQIFNYWAAADYEQYGHIPGALQLTPGSVTSDMNLNALDPAEDNVIYCWTGQTSALTTFYLNVLGYDALSLKFGANGMIYDELASHKWTAPMGYEYEGGTTVNEFEVLSDHTDTNFATYSSGWIQSADYVHDMMADLFIVDIRAAADYANGHIDGAMNVTVADLPTFVASNNTEDLPVAIVCYSGQTASFAAMGMRMLGWDAFTMKFGMAGWHSNFAGSWDNNIGSDYVADFVTDVSETLPVNAWPTIETGLSSAEAILAAQIDAVFTEGFGANAVSAATVFGDLAGYEIFNYWAESDYLGYGHIPGAYQLTPGTVTTDTNLSAMSPDASNVIYCWTGQTSALTACYLSVLGYDALSLKFGANGMIYDELESHTWTGSADYEFVTGN